jgi:hypothetical protein
MRLSSLPIPNMNHLETQGDEHIGNHAPVTTPPEDLGAHDRGPETVGRQHELDQAGGELLGVDVIGVAPKGRVPPGGVIAGDRAPAAAQLRNPGVGDAFTVQC